MIKALIGTVVWIFLNGLGLVLLLNSSGFLKFIGYFNYLLTGLILLFVVNKYMESDFYKRLGKEDTQR